MNILPLQLPPTQNIVLKKQNFLSFLKANILGTCDLEWDSQGTRICLRIERKEREVGAYYRDPYPLILTVLCPDVLSFPRISYPVTESDVQSLISALQ